MTTIRTALLRKVAPYAIPLTGIVPTAALLPTVDDTAPVPVQRVWQTGEGTWEAVIRDLTASESTAVTLAVHDFLQVPSTVEAESVHSDFQYDDLASSPIEDYTTWRKVKPKVTRGEGVPPVIVDESELRSES